MRPYIEFGAEKLVITSADADTGMVTGAINGERFETVMDNIERSDIRGPIKIDAKLFSERG